MADSSFLAPGPLRRASHRLTLGLLGVALVMASLAATARPARAQHDDLVRFLLGAAAVAIIVRGLDSSAGVGYIDRRTLPAGCVETVRLDGRQVDVFNGRCLQRAGYHGLPQRCEVNFRTRQGGYRGYEASCLQRAGYRIHHGGYRPQPTRPHDRVGVLPRQCEMTYRRGNQRLSGYDARCLRQSGLRNLPQQCAMTARDGQRLYDGQCLQNAGYRRGRR